MRLPKSCLLWALEWCTTPWFWHVPALPFWGSASSAHPLPCIPLTLGSQWAMSYYLWLAILPRGLQLTLTQLWALHIWFHYSKSRKPSCTVYSTRSLVVIAKWAYPFSTYKIHHGAFNVWVFMPNRCHSMRK